MPVFDRILIVDWSASGRPKRGRDSLWLGDATGARDNPATRAEAFALIRRAVAGGGRLLIGVDVAFGHPDGLVQAVTGQDSALALWDWLAARHRDDDRNASTWRDQAALMNRILGRPAFWGDVRRLPTPDLPRRRPPDPPLPPLRATDRPMPGARPKSPFQTAGAGAVGAQSLTAIPWLNRLRADPAIAVWPFQPIRDARVVLAEVYPSMMGITLRDRPGHPCLDAMQVTELARVLARLDARDALAGMLRPDPALPPSEGQILGDPDVIRAEARWTGR